MRLCNLNLVLPASQAGMVPSEEVMRSCDCPFCAAYRSRLLAGRKGGALPAGDLGVLTTRMHCCCLRNGGLQGHAAAR